ncbi:hypothetical protein L195_g051847 [Trifolium pratense]|uniref:Uncharacterized protein n=1 Tax=Trifolium pratense TaxID=57577 RepID=A0A2K3K1Y6_TRIPR|nr:hypothetical protein L195_g051847 [Trifolium pratense]
MIADRMISSKEGLFWRWEWRAALTQSEEHDLTKLKELLLDVNLNPNSIDRWRWIIGSAGLFSVNSCYNFLAQRGAAEDINPSLLEALKNLWQNDVPSKRIALIFSILAIFLKWCGMQHSNGWDVD